MDVPKVLATSDLVGREGLTHNELAASCRRGERQRLRRGAYLLAADVDAVSRHRCLIEATVPLVHPDSAVSHVSAAVLHGLPLPRTSLDRVWVTRPGGGNGRIGRHLHLRNCRLEPDEVVSVDGVRVTSLARTAADLARAVGYPWGVVGCDAALAMGCPVEELVEVVERGRRRPGNARARCAVAFADGRSESPLESLSRVTIARLRLPSPTLQFEIRDGARLVARTDFGWEEDGVVGEVDGAVKYGPVLKPGQTPADAVMAEKRREAAIRARHWWVVRWGAREASDPTALMQLLGPAFESARRRARKPSA